MSEFWTFTLTGIIAGWPPAAAGMWLTWRLAKKQVAKEMKAANEKQLSELAEQNHTQMTAMLAAHGITAPPQV